jgi:conjugal transfer mating pair stabilization protein TraN
MSRFPALACLAGACALIATSVLNAQTTDPKAVAAQIAGQLQDQITGTVTSQSAPNAVPGYSGADLPQGNYLARPDMLANDGAIQATTSEPYAIVTNPNRATVDPATLGLANAKTVETSPNSFTGSGIGAGGSQGNCQQLPPSSGAPSTYYDSCQIGQAEADTSLTCTIGWNNQLTSAYQYTCHRSEWDIYNPNTNQTFFLGDVSDCGSFASQSSCSQVAQTTKAPQTTWPPGAGIGLTFTETDTTYNCTGQTNFGTAASSNYCVNHSAWCFVPPPQDQAPGVPGATYVGPAQTYQGSAIDNGDCQAKLGAAAACSPGYVQQGGQCVQTTAATVTYSCPAGWSVAGNQCSQIIVQAASLTGYSCPAGFTLSGTTCNESQPATASGYSCPAGYVLGGTSCTSNQTQAATPTYTCPSGWTRTGTTCSGPVTQAAGTTYSCPAGWVLSGTNCTQSTSQAATPSYSCPAGYTLTGSVCQEVLTQTASPTYSCPAGFTVSGSSCTQETSYSATPAYSCPSGMTLSGTTCTSPSNYAATATWSCPAGWTLSGSTCSQPTTYQTSTYSCPSGGTISQFRYACHASQWDLVFSYSNQIYPLSTLSDCGSFASEPSCSQVSQTSQAPQTTWGNAYGIGSQFTESDYVYSCSGSTNLGTAASSTYCIGTSGCYDESGVAGVPGVPGASYAGATCTGSSTQGATPTYSCPSGGTLSGSTCITSTTQPADVSYSCPAGGTVSGQNCGTTSSQAASIQYTCPVGFTLSGGTCTEMLSQGATSSYSCPTGTTLSGSQCVATSTQPATASYGCPTGYTLTGTMCTGTGTQVANVSYACPTGWTLSGSACNLTSTIAATPAYACPAGMTLSGTQCVASQSASPSYSCPAGFIVDGSTCTQNQNQAATASYSCPTGTTVSGANCIATVAATSSGGAGGMTCMPPTQVCVDSAPATRIVAGVPVTHDCWQWQATYQCGTLSSANDCASLQAKSNCSFDHEVCLDDPQNGQCQVRSEVYKCTTPAASPTSPAYSCSGDVYCIDGSCTQLPHSASPDLAKALVAMNAMNDAKSQFNASNLTIFDGQATGCHKPLFGLVNCCAGKVSGLLTGASAAIAMTGLLTGNFTMLLGLVTQFLPLLLCSREEMLLDVKDRLGLCHYVGEYCSQHLLFVCATERKTYCCYQSKLARVIQEQGRAQLGLDFGTAKNPTCAGFTVDQFSKLDLSKMDFTEVFADFTSAVSLPSSLQTSSEIQQKVQAYYQNHGPGTGQ